MHIKKIILSAIVIAASLLCATGADASTILPRLPRHNLNFIVLSDSGDKVDSTRIRSAAMAVYMDRVVEENNISFVAHTGDVIHDMGVKDSSDPEWKYKLLDVYSASHLMGIPWHVVPGNHEYRGNAQAVPDFSAKCEWWKSPSRYFSMVEKAGRQKVLMLYLDTSPMIDKYLSSNGNSFDASYAPTELAWADSVLKASDADWKIALGHHPVYSHSDKSEEERQNLQDKLLPVLEANGVQLYINGHIHNFQHIKRNDSPVTFITNASGAKRRNPQAVEGTIYCSSGPGFSVWSVGKKEILFFFVSNRGEVLHSGKVSK